MFSLLDGKKDIKFHRRLNFDFFFVQVPAPEAVLKLTTAPPMETVGTAPRASTDNVIPSMTGRSSKKSNPPPKKSNKRGAM